MKLSVTNAALLDEVKGQLEAGGFEHLRLDPLVDFAINDLVLPVYWVTLAEKIGSDLKVVDAWLIVSEVQTHRGPVRDVYFYNNSNYDDVQGAVAQHLGTLVLEGKLKLVNGGYAPTMP